MPNPKLICVLLLGSGCEMVVGRSTITSTSGSSSGATSSSTGIGTGSGTSSSTTTGSGTSGAGSTGGSSNGGAVCADAGSCDLNQCPSNDVAFGVQVTDFIEGTPVDFEVEVTDLTTGQTFVSSPCGVVNACFPPGTIVSLETGPTTGYVSTILNDLQLNHSECLSPTLPLLSDPLDAAFERDPLIPAFAANMASVLVRVIGRGCELAGWTFHLETADGGTVEAPVAYLTGRDLAQGDGGTISSGVAVFYNLDVGDEGESLTVVGSSSNGGCQYDGGQTQLLPTVQVRPEAVSMVIYPVVPVE